MLANRVPRVIHQLRGVDKENGVLERQDVMEKLTTLADLLAMAIEEKDDGPSDSTTNMAIKLFASLADPKKEEKLVEVIFSQIWQSVNFFCVKGSKVILNYFGLLYITLYF